MGICVLHAVENWCEGVELSINLDKTGPVVLTRRNNSLLSFTILILGLFTFLYVCKLSRGSPGFSADLEGACGYQGKEGSQLLRACGATRGLSRRVFHCQSAIHHFCILSLEAWLSDSECQEKTKEGRKTCILRNNGSDEHHSY